MTAHPGKKLLFMGCEFGQWREWNAEASLDWPLLDQPLHRGLLHLVRDLNHTYAGEPALYERDYDTSGFKWIDCTDHENSVIAFQRIGADADHPVVAIVNWTPRVREGYRIGVPHPGYWREVINTDLPQYGGSGVSLGGGVDSEPIPSHGFAQSISLKLPPLGALILKRSGRGVSGGQASQGTRHAAASPHAPGPTTIRPWDERSGKGTNCAFGVTSRTLGGRQRARRGSGHA